MLKQIFWTNLQGFDLHIGGGGGVYTESLACSQFLVLHQLLNMLISGVYMFCPF